MGGDDVVQRFGAVEWPLTLVGVVLHLELQLLPLQLQEVHLDLQVLLLRLQRILELDEFLVGGRGGSVKSAGTTVGHKQDQVKDNLAMSCGVLRILHCCRSCDRRGQTGDGCPTEGMRLTQSASLAPPSLRVTCVRGGNGEANTAPPVSFSHCRFCFFFIKLLTMTAFFSPRQSKSTKS